MSKNTEMNFKPYSPFIIMIKTLVFFLILSKGGVVLSAYQQHLESGDKEDKQFRAKVVGKGQVEIEQSLIHAKNGVFVLFTPTHGTPLMISEEGEIPEGLIPQEKMDSYNNTVKPRVQTTHEMPKQGVKCIFIRHQAHREDAGNK